LPTWFKRYFTIKEGGFSWVVVTKKRDGKVSNIYATPISILLCNVRKWEKEDRRFTFDIYTSKKSFVLQAENEDEMKSCMSCFQNTKNKAAGIEPEDSAAGASNNQLDADQDDQEDDDSADEEEKDDLSFAMEDNSAATEKFKYSDHALEKKNVELHHLLKSVPESDIVFAVYSVGLQKDIVLQGKMSYYKIQRPGDKNT
jgi:hypothetical protein